MLTLRAAIFDFFLVIWYISSEMNASKKKAKGLPSLRARQIVDAIVRGEAPPARYDALGVAKALAEHTLFSGLRALEEIFRKANGQDVEKVAKAVERVMQTFCAIEVAQEAIKRIKVLGGKKSTAATMLEQAKQIAYAFSDGGDFETFDKLIGLEERAEVQEAS